MGGLLRCSLLGLVALMGANGFMQLEPRRITSALNSGMDAYEAQLRALSGGGRAAEPPAAAAVVPVAPAPAAAAPPVVTTTDPIGTLEASQQASLNDIAAAIPDLAPRPDLSWTVADGVLVAGSPATLDARDAPGPANIAWLAALCIAGRQSSLTIFNGPLTNVPHFQSRVCHRQEDHSLSFVLDFRPRAYGAYERQDAAGNYPGPEELGRKAFEYAGNRNEYFQKFVTDRVRAFLDATRASFHDCHDTVSVDCPEESLTRGPHKLAVTMPATPSNVAAICQARRQAVHYWIDWATDRTHSHRPGAPINAQHVYDSKYKIQAFGALLPVYRALYGPQDGAALTAAESGPLDEAYVGGGS